MTKNIHQENKALKHKLEIAESWMKREIQNQILAVSKKHTLEKTGEKNIDFLSQEMDSIIVQKILSFFSDIPLNLIPEDMVEHLTKSEVQYYLLSKGIHVDTLPITIGYQKILEGLIEDFIISPFRIYEKTTAGEKSKNPDALENALTMVIEKSYTLSIGRLYHLLSQYSQDRKIEGYKKVFYDFLNAHNFLKNTLLDNKFLVQLQHVVESEVFSTKRHIGTISSQDIEDIRRLCIGDMSHKDCLIYSLFQTQNTI